MGLPPKVRATVTGFALSGAVTVGVAGVLARSQGLGPAYELIPLTILLALGWAFPLRVLRAEETEAFQLDEAFFVAMALLLSGPGTVLAFVAATVLGVCLRRRPLPRAAFNIGQTVTAAGLGVAAMHLLAAPGGAVATPRQLAAAVVGAAVFLAVNTAAVSLVISQYEQRRPLQVLVEGLDLRVLVWAGGTALGLLAAIGGADHSWALVLGVLPMAALSLVLREHAHARRQTQRAEGLFLAAGQIHSSVALPEVERAIISATASLLHCREARIDANPPGVDEVGARIPGPGADRWLVAGHTLDSEPLGATEREVLTVVAGIAGRAIENARHLEREQESRERLEEIDRIKTDFVSSVSHELRTPLTSILGYMEMLGDGYAGQLNGEQLRMLGIVNRNAERLLVLIEELLLMSSLESGTLRLAVAPVSMRSLLDEAHQAVLPELTAKGLDIEIEVADDADLITADAPRLDRALINLLGNAVKFTPAGGRVSVAVTRDGGSVRIEVADTGIGIPIEDQPKVFDRFFRSTTATEMAVPGTGLGLSITKMIVEAHGGTISVASTVGHGTTMTVTLPVQAPTPPPLTRPRQRVGDPAPVAR